ncbi:MAG: carbohydrate ABC transporter permease [Thermomicrobiales bacterium]|nr:carbohydrate ABC transporter permease [Thermomicrobiales bacterium]
MIASHVTTQMTTGKPAETHHRKRRIKWGTVARHAVLILLCLWVLLPLAWVVLLSFKSKYDGARRYIWPENFIDPIFANYQYILSQPRAVGPVGAVTTNSITVTLLTVFFGTIAAVLGGYALVHLRTPGKVILTSFLVASMFFPTQVTALTGIFQIQQRLGFINTTWALMFPYVALQIAICVFIMRGVFQTVPQDLVDSAKVDGASSLRTLAGIIFPLVKNGIVVVVIVLFVFAWGEYLLALTLMNDASKRTLAVFVANSTGGVGALDWPRTAALYILAILPALVTFAIAQRWYMKGLQEGALKG